MDWQLLKSDASPPPTSLDGSKTTEVQKAEPVTAMMTEECVDYEALELIEKPDSPKNCPSMPHTLEGCEGHLTKLPLLPPNVNQNKPYTISNMVNILTNPTAEDLFINELITKADTIDIHRKEGDPSEIFDYDTSDMMKDLASSMHRRLSHVPFTFGRITRSGCISFYTKDGKIYAVPEGRWILPNPKASWENTNLNLDRSMIGGKGNGDVLVLRVSPGEIGCVARQGVPLLLDVGTHVFNSGLVDFKKSVNLSREIHFEFQQYHWVRVPHGHYGKITAMQKSGDAGNMNNINRSGNNRNNTASTLSLKERLLEEGDHYIDSHYFRFDGLVKVDQEHVSHGAMHVINVPKGHVAKVFQDNIPRLLGEGTHFIESTQFEYKGLVSLISNHCIVHGTITILRVIHGMIALAWGDNNAPMFIDKPGLYEFNSPDFVFVEFKSAEERLISLGSKKIILVHTGQVGVSYDQGLLKILPHGRHIINSSTHIFHRFMSVQQKSIRLATLNAAEKEARVAALKSSVARNSDTSHSHSKTTAASMMQQKRALDPDSDLTICETKDLVKVGLRADVFYSIDDPEKCINNIDVDEVEDLVRETAVATLTNIIRSTALNQIAQSQQVTAGSLVRGIPVLPPHPDAEQQGLLDANSSTGGATVPLAVFFDRAHDEFLDKLHDDFMHRYGVNIANIRIEAFKIMDTELSEQISKHALTTAQIENRMANLEGQALISTTEEKTAAEVKMINAESDAKALKTKNDAQNQRRIDTARADAEALLIAEKARAEAYAEGILSKAKAEAEAIRLKAEAEARRAEVLSCTSLGQQEALLNIYSNMVSKSNEGVQKVVYLDPTINKDSPFALGSLNELNRDLHSLSQIGIAADEAKSATAITTSKRS